MKQFVQNSPICCALVTVFFSVETYGAFLEKSLFFSLVFGTMTLLWAAQLISLFCDNRK